MDIFKFIKSLVPVLDKNRIQSETKATLDLLNTTVLPSYKAATVTINSLLDKKSSDYKYIVDKFYSEVNTSGYKPDNIVSDIATRLDRVVINLQYVLEQIELLFEKDIIAEGLTAKKAILLRASSDINFIANYSLGLLNYLYAISGSEELGISSYNLKYIEGNIKSYAVLLQDFSMDNKKFIKILTPIPDVIANSNTEGSIKGTGMDVDPLASGHIANFSGSPVFFIRRKVADWQANKYRADQDLKKLLELRLLNLTMSKDGNNDPGLEKEINYVQGRVDKLKRELLEIETDLGI